MTQLWNSLAALPLLAVACSGPADSTLADSTSLDASVSAATAALTGDVYYPATRGYCSTFGPQVAGSATYTTLDECCSTEHPWDAACTTTGALTYYPNWGANNCNHDGLHGRYESNRNATLADCCNNFNWSQEIYDACVAGGQGSEATWGDPDTWSECSCLTKEQSGVQVCSSPGECEGDPQTVAKSCEPTGCWQAPDTWSACSCATGEQSGDRICVAAEGCVDDPTVSQQCEATGCWSIPDWDACRCVDGMQSGTRQCVAPEGCAPSQLADQACTPTDCWSVDWGTCNCATSTQEGTATCTNPNNLGCEDTPETSQACTITGDCWGPQVGSGICECQEDGSGLEAWTRTCTSPDNFGCEEGADSGFSSCNATGCGGGDVFYPAERGYCSTFGPRKAGTGTVTYDDKATCCAAEFQWDAGCVDAGQFVYYQDWAKSTCVNDGMQGRWAGTTFSDLTTCCATFWDSQLCESGGLNNDMSDWVTGTCSCETHEAIETRECLLADPTPSQCTGAKSRTIANCDPGACGWDEWQWGSCSCSGQQGGTRECTLENPGPGECDGDETDTKSCTPDLEQCASGWSDWTFGACGCDQLKVGTRVCDQLGAPCTYGDTDTWVRDCIRTDCVIDGGWTSERRSLCCGGERAVTRSCTAPAPQNGGANCAGSASFNEACSFDRCNGVPISQHPPAGLTGAQVPMFVTLGFDDNNYAGLDANGPDGNGAMTWATSFFRSLVNPAGTGNAATFDGTPARVSFYMTTTYLQDQYVKESWRVAWRDGHEIANHTVSHPGGAAYSKEQWVTEMSDANEALFKPYLPDALWDANGGMGANPDEMFGFRTPYLEHGPGTVPALKEVGFLYDCSIEYGWGVAPYGAGSPAVDGTNMPWPYTLDTDNGGLWELPVNAFVLPGGGWVPGFDYNMWVSMGMTKDEFVEVLKYNYTLREQGNRSPMMIGTHSNYYSPLYSKQLGSETPQEDARMRQAAIEEFILWVLEKPDARVVPMKAIVDWMQNPVPLPTP